MINLDLWAAKWGVPKEAVAELRADMLGADSLDLKKGGESEGAVAAEVRLEGAELGFPLWRNNVGVLFNEDGVPVRYGLANDSKKINQKIKSHDLIGCRPVLIQPRHVGSTFGLFVSRETKRRGWVYKGTDREKAQLKFAEIVIALGGDAAFVTGRGSF